MNCETNFIMKSFVIFLRQLLEQLPLQKKVKSSQIRSVCAWNFHNQFPQTGRDNFPKLGGTVKKYNLVYYLWGNDNSEKSSFNDAGFTMLAAFSAIHLFHILMFQMSDNGINDATATSYESWSAKFPIKMRTCSHRKQSVSWEERSCTLCGLRLVLSS